jgi:hypothetical protein
MKKKLAEMANDWMDIIVCCDTIVETQLIAFPQTTATNGSNNNK